MNTKIKVILILLFTLLIFTPILIISWFNIQNFDHYLASLPIGFVVCQNSTLFVCDGKLTLMVKDMRHFIFITKHKINKIYPVMFPLSLFVLGSLPLLMIPWNLYYFYIVTSLTVKHFQHPRMSKIFSFV